MGGFFSTKELAPKSPRCKQCRLDRKCTSPRMTPSGKGREGILVIADTPGTVEDKAGEVLVGPAGKYLRRTLQGLGVDLDKDCRTAYTVNCYPPEGRNPTPEEIAHCRPVWEQELEENPPAVVILLGGIALEAVYGDRWEGGLGGVSRWRGYAIPDKELGCWVVPTYHPNYLLRLKEDATELTAFQQDLDMAVRLMEERGSSSSYNLDTPNIECLTRSSDILRRLEQVGGSDGLVAFDYETTGLKPYLQDHDILSCAMAWDTPDGSISVAFPMGDPDVRYAVCEILEDPGVRKIAANAPFEQLWTSVVLETELRGLVFDTVLAAHLLDNREGTPGVKFQTAVRFGELGWDVGMNQFKRGRGKLGSNNFNEMAKCPITTLLRYNALDSYYELELAHVLAGELGVDL